MVLFKDKSSSFFKAAFIGNPMYLGVVCNNLVEEYKNGKDVTLYVSSTEFIGASVREIQITDKFKIVLLDDIENEAILANRVYVTKDFSKNAINPDVNSCIDPNKIVTIFNSATNREVLKEAALGKLVITETNTSLTDTKLTSLAEVDSLFKALGGHCKVVFAESYIDPSREELDSITAKYNGLGIYSMHIFKRKSGYLHFYKNLNQVYDFFVNSLSTEYLRMGGTLYIPAELERIQGNALRALFLTYKINSATRWLTS